MNTAPLGSKENPIYLYNFEIDEIRNFLAEAEFNYESHVDPESQQVIRREARRAIFRRWPQLYDDCCIAERPHDHFAAIAHFLCTRARARQ